MSERCWSCDHEVAMHQPEGCWYTVAVGTMVYLVLQAVGLDANAVCPCSLDRVRAGADLAFADPPTGHPIPPETK